jgi:GMP synthase-like glutamine amidotransferase
MQIGILTTGRLPEEIASDTGQYPDMFRRLFADEGFDWRTWHVLDDDFPDGPKAADGWLITGSRHGVYDGMPWIARLEGFVRDVMAADRPIVGICFGHQAMAEALGGRVEKFAGGWSVGRHAYDWGGKVRHLNAWHQDQVIEPPPGAGVVASSDFTAHAALRYGPKAMSVQPHPEFDDGVVRGLIAARGGALPPSLLAEAEAGLGLGTDARAVARDLAAVLKGEAHHG